MMGNKEIWSARETAVRVLHEVEELGAFSNLALKKALWEQKHLEQRDKNFVTALVYGTEKKKLHMDHIIQGASHRKTSRISPWILAILRAGIYQILYLDKVPSFAAVNESVELSKRENQGKASGFVNGVLRKVARDKDRLLEEQLPLHLRLSVPKFLLDELGRYYSEEMLASFFEASLMEAPLSLRWNTLKTNKDALQARLLQEGVESRKGNYAKQSLITSGLQHISLLNSYRDGDYIIQDEGAMLSVELLAPEPGDRVLDLCAAPGGKSTHLGELVGSEGLVLARDIHEHKLALVEDNARRLGLQNIRTQWHDGTEPLSEGDRNAYDRVLLDAPCSGLGILRRKPDIKYHLSRQKFHQLVQLQKPMILNAFDALAPGGVLVYTTCTVHPRENREVVEYLLRQRENARVDVEGMPPHLRSLAGEDGMIQLWPQIHDTDGFFMVRVVKNL